MKKISKLGAIAVVGAGLLLAAPALSHGTGGEKSGSDSHHMGHGMMGYGHGMMGYGHGMMGYGHGMMGYKMMHSQEYSNMTPADRDAMHKEMGAVMEKWMPGFDAEKFNKDKDCAYGEGKK